MIDYLEQCRTINVGIEIVTPGNRKNKARKLTHGVLLLQDNAPAHTSQVAMAAASECGFEILPHPPYIWLLLTSICSQNLYPFFMVHSFEVLKASKRRQ